jgi:hypothetical protein
VSASRTAGGRLLLYSTTHSHPSGWALMMPLSGLSSHHQDQPWSWWWYRADSPPARLAAVWTAVRRALAPSSEIKRIGTCGPPRKRKQ